MREFWGVQAASPPQEGRIRRGGTHSHRSLPTREPAGASLRVFKELFGKLPDRRRQTGGVKISPKFLTKMLTRSGESDNIAQLLLHGENPNFIYEKEIHFAICLL
jgi:hypothetical protein